MDIILSKKKNIISYLFNYLTCTKFVYSPNFSPNFSLNYIKENKVHLSFVTIPASPSTSA